MKARLAWGVALLTACGGYSGPSAELTRERARQRPTEAVVDAVGGEPREPSGGIVDCLETTSSEPLDLNDPEVASWVAMVQGHHEQTLGWRRLVLSDELAGFEEHTSVSIDVNVTGGRERVYESGGSTEGALAGCEGVRVREIELEITFATADGAVAATFRRWFAPAPSDWHGTVVQFYGPLADESGAVALGGTLELNFEPALGGTPSVWVQLEFSADSVRGSWAPAVMPGDDARDGAPLWPIEAIFPDDPCGSIGSEGRSIALDEFSTELGGAPRAIYQRMPAARAPARLGAVWRSSPSDVVPSPADLPLDVPPATQVTLIAGEPTRACLVGTTVTVHAPLTVTTADGLVSFTQPFIFNLSEGSAYIGERTPWVPAGDFNERSGIGDVNLQGGYGSIYFQSFVDWRSRLIEGALEVSHWNAFSDRRAAYPVLEWCNASVCAAGAQ